MKAIYSNCIGSFVFEKGLVDSMLFGGKNAVEKCIQLERGEIIEEEKKLMKKYPDAFFLNKKTEDVKQLEETEKIQEILSCFTGKSHEFFETELALVKRKLRESVSFDNLLINASDSVDELNKCINILSGRLREWFELHCPEISRKIQDNIAFADAVVKKSKKDFDKELGLSESMGADLKEIDIFPIKNLAGEIVNMNKLKEKHEKYMDELMKEHCPNIRAVAGTNLGAKLIALAGSFERIALLPASTIQILGAEKALFRHIKTGAKSPKHGVILQHPLVLDAREKGKAARQVADKTSIAAKLDFFKGGFMGDKLLKELKEKLAGGKNGS
jgi:nucleolar protein 56